MQAESISNYFGRIIGRTKKPDSVTTPPSPPLKGKGTAYIVCGRNNIMDVYEILKEDHETVAGLLKKLDKTSEEASENREKLFLELKTELTLHAYIEELLFYPLLKDKNESKEITLEAYEEHRLVKTLLEELDSMSKDSEEWIGKFRVLKENVEHHVEEEEGELFEKARNILSSEDAAAIGAQIATEKAKLKASV
jgi:hemerythrin HHE cation binding domain-containing protein